MLDSISAVSRASGVAAGADLAVDAAEVLDLARAGPAAGGAQELDRARQVGRAGRGCAPPRWPRDRSRPTTTWASGSTWRRPPSRLTMPSESRPRSGSGAARPGRPALRRPPPAARRTAGAPAGSAVRPPRRLRERTARTPSDAETWWHLSASGSHDPRGTDRSRDTVAGAPTHRGGLGGFPRKGRSGLHAGALSPCPGPGPRLRRPGLGLR